MVIFHSYVSLPEGKQPIGFWVYTIFGTHMQIQENDDTGVSKKKHAYPT